MIHRISDAAAHGWIPNDGVVRDHSCPESADAPHENSLRIVAGGFRSNAAHPPRHRLLEDIAGPISGIPTREMHRDFSAGTDRFADLVSSHEKSLAMRLASSMEFELLRV